MGSICQLLSPWHWLLVVLLWVWILCSGLAILKLGMDLFSILNNNLMLLLDSGVEVLELSFWSWATQLDSETNDRLVTASGVGWWGIGFAIWSPLTTRFRCDIILKSRIPLSREQSCDGEASRRQVCMEFVSWYLSFPWTSMLAHWMCELEAGDVVRPYS